jgi:uncharacterized protein YbbK (DUF523 family)/uncharacterized protein YbgA (DUF1722 family)
MFAKAYFEQFLVSNVSLGLISSILILYHKMVKFVKPTILVSKCLGFEKCRWNGETIPDNFVEDLKPFVNLIKVCPEAEIGLGIPRKPIRLVLDKDKIELFQPATEKKHTEKMIDFSIDFLSKQDNIDGFILKFRSPSCGLKNVKVYTGYGKNVGATKGIGLFAEKCIELFSDASFEDEGRLKDIDLRNHFLQYLYVNSSFRQVSSIKQLSDFHAANKYLFTSYNQALTTELGRIASNSEHKRFNEVKTAYRRKLTKLFSQMQKRGDIINTLSKIYGYFKKDVTEKEKSHFFEVIELYRDERIPLNSLLEVLSVWAERYYKQYILNQTIFQPYPQELIPKQGSLKCYIQ